jgi:hypothetical protein
MSRGLQVRLWVVLLSAAMLCHVLAGPAEGRIQVACSPESVGVDTSLATASGDIVLGKAWGETFVASDTLILSVTVWRIPSEHNDPSGLKFWVTQVDSSGTPHTHLVVYEGPILSVVSADSTRPTKIEYVFDPPISLPRPSVYCFWVQEVCTGYADLLIDGQLWQTSRSNFEGCILRDYPAPFPGADLVFRMEFCGGVTPTRRTSWGELKVRYR